MASQSRKTGFPDLVADLQSAESVRRKFFEAPMAGAEQSVLGTAAALASFMGMIPDAFAASQRRELNRILKSGDDRDPRVMALQASIEQAEILQATASQGKARVERAVGALAGGGELFHGFVSDSSLAPMEGLTVRLTRTGDARAKSFTARTEADGYFTIDLGAKDSPIRDRPTKDRPIEMSRRIADMFVGRSDDATSSPTGSGDASRGDASTGEVEILKGATLLYRDPVPVTLGEGSIYREYVVAGSGSSSSDTRATPSSRSSAGTRGAKQPTRAVRQPARSTKQPTRGAKSARPMRKK